MDEALFVFQHPGSHVSSEEMNEASRISMAMSDDDIPLHEMERLFAQSGKPAATAIRIGKKKYDAKSLNENATAKDEANVPHHVIGDIVEKRTFKARSKTDISEKVRNPGTEQGFPQAQHRQRSKFSLAKQRSPAVPSSSAQEIANSVQSSINILPQLPERSANFAIPSDESASVVEIRKQNDAFVGQLSPYEIQKLQEEIRNSLKPEVIEKLKNKRSPPNQASKKPSRPTTEAKQHKQQPSHPLHRKARTEQSKNHPLAPQLESQTGRVTNTAVATLPSLVRTRFSLDGQPIGWVSDEEVVRGTSVSEVAQRDPLRRDEGSVPDGYTVEEAVLLLSSSHPHSQRAAAPIRAVIQNHGSGTGSRREPT